MFPSVSGFWTRLFRYLFEQIVNYLFKIVETISFKYFFSIIDQGEDIVIHRVLVGGYINKLGLLKRGDIIREVNNQEFENAEQLKKFISETNGSLVFKLAVKLDSEETQNSSTPFIKELTVNNKVLFRNFTL